MQGAKLSCNNLWGLGSLTRRRSPPDSANNLGSITIVALFVAAPGPFVFNVLMRSEIEVVLARVRLGASSSMEEESELIEIL